MPHRSVPSHRRPWRPAVLAMLLVLIGLFEPTWAVAGPCCPAGEDGDCCCQAEHEAHSAPGRSCCSGEEEPTEPSPCDLPGGCSCRAVPPAPTPLFVAPPSLEAGGRSADALDWLASAWIRTRLEPRGWFLVGRVGADRAPPDVGPGDPPRPRGALRRSLLARLAELSIARI